MGNIEKQLLKIMQDVENLEGVEQDIFRELYNKYINAFTGDFIRTTDGLTAYCEAMQHTDNDFDTIEQLVFDFVALVRANVTHMLNHSEYQRRAWKYLTYEEEIFKQSNKYYDKWMEILKSLNINK